MAVNFVFPSFKRTEQSNFVFLCIMVCLCAVLLQCKDCLAADGCSNSDLGIDISSLGNTDGTPRFKDMNDQMSGGIWLYSYNPCFPFSEGDCKGQAVCQVSSGHDQYFQCGDASSATWSKDSVSNNPTLVYTNHGVDIDRKSVVELICDESATVPQVTAIGDISNGEYLTSICACPNKCSGISYTVEVEISVGTILLIIVLVVAVLYFAGGMVFNKFQRQRTGKEIVPNISFWQALPGLVKDGFLFTTSKITGGKRKQYDRI